MTWIAELAAALYKLARPYLTILIATVYNVTCTWAVIKGKMTVNDYVQSIGPTNAMIVGFWFGERAALKNGKDSE